MWAFRVGHFQDPDQEVDRGAENNGVQIGGSVRNVPRLGKETGHKEDPWVLGFIGFPVNAWSTSARGEDESSESAPLRPRDFADMHPPAIMEVGVEQSL